MKRARPGACSCRRRAGGAETHVPADGEAGDVRRQRLERGFSGNPLLARVEEYAKREGAPVVPISAAIEAQMGDLSDEDKQVPRRHGHEGTPGSTADPRRLRATWACRPIHAGPKEVRAWTVQVGATAPQAAGVIHTDFERGFIRAEVTSFADYVAGKGEQGAKEAGSCGWKARTTSSATAT